jgi:hypothetical protein
MMEENANIIEELIEKAVDYGKSSLELAKLKALDKISGAVSSLLAFSIVIIVLFTFMLFLNLGLALWIGKILGEIYYGFFVCAGFYGISAILIYFFLQKWIKKQVGNAVIKHLLK